MSEVEVPPDYTVAQVAAIVQQTERSIWRQCRAGKIPSYRVGKSVRIRREDVEKLRQPQPPSDYIRDLIESAPPLTETQRARLAELLTPVRRNGGDHSG